MGWLLIGIVVGIALDALGVVRFAFYFIVFTIYYALREMDILEAIQADLEKILETGPL